MKRLFCLIFVFSLFFLSACNFGALSMKNKSSGYNSALIEEKTYSSQQDLINSVSPAIVGISAISGGYQSIGSGVCVNEKGYVLTNNHVVEDAGLIKLYLHNNTTSNAQLIWKDASLDLAVLKSDVNLPYLAMAESGSYNAGEDVFAIGTPISLAFKHSVTKGVISALNRTIQVDNDYGESSLSNLIQHDASINPGNSGGPLIDLKGRVIGINTVKVTDAEGMGFAIPISIGEKIVSRLSANGNYETAYLGVFGYDANLTKIGCNNCGVFVADVKENSPASYCGLQQGDIITSFNGSNINSVLDLRLNLYSFNNGDEINLNINRNGKNINKTVTLSQHPCCYKNTKLNYEDFN